MPHAAGARIDLDASGRGDELRRLLRLVDGAASPKVCFVRGPAGIGKSFLLDVFARELRIRGGVVLSASGRRHSRKPYGLFSDLLSEALSMLPEIGVPEARRSELAQRTRPIIGAVALGDDDSARFETVTAEDRRSELFESVNEILDLLGARRRLAVLLDDVEAADGASLDLLEYLSRGVAGAPSSKMKVQSVTAPVWVIALGDDLGAHPRLATIVNDVRSVSMSLGALDLSSVQAILSRPSMLERVLDTTGGVPGSIEAMLRGGLSADVPSLALHRVDKLAGEARRSLLVLAALGRPVTQSRLNELLAAWTRREARADVGSLLAEGLVEIRASEGEQPLVRLRAPDEAGRLLASLSESDSRELHGALGRTLEKIGAEPSEIAHHHLLSDPSGEGFDWAVRAGDALVARLAFEDAARAYRGALELLEDEDSERAIALQEKLQGLYSSLSEHRRAAHWLGRLKRAYRGRPERLREIDARAARLCLALGKPALAERLCRRVLGEAFEPEAVDSSVPVDGPAVSALADLTEACWARGDYEQSRALARGGLRLLRDGDHASEQAGELLSMRNTLGKIHLQTGDYEAARSCFAENADAAREGRPRERARALNNLGVVAHRGGDRAEALRYYRDSLALRMESGDRAREAFALQNIAALYHEIGDVEAAIDHYHRALSGFTRAGALVQVCRTSCNLANLYVFMGDLERAAGLLEQGREISMETGDRYLQGYVDLVDGHLRHTSGDHEGARRAYEAAIERFEALESPRYLSEARIALARLACEHGEIELGRSVLETMSPSLEGGRFAALVPEYHLVLASLQLRADDLEGAAESLGRAKEVLLEAPNLEGPVVLYHLRSELGARRGDPAGAEADAQRCQRLLADLASRVPAAHRETFLAVSARRWVSDGCAENEITPDGLRRALAIEEDDRAKCGLRGGERPSAIVGTNSKLMRLLSLIPKVAKVSMPVLIRGASGSGKELIADAIHEAGPRRKMPFIKVNCAAMHEELLLSELFGHEKGSFTGAHQNRKGRFELADGGTLFLDEVGEMSPSVQVALLRVLQQQRFERVGGNKTIQVDVRVVCATNSNLEELIARGSFREDLYYRLKGITLELPRLRDRLDDLPGLVEHFLQKTATERAEARSSVSPEVMRVFESYHWPGNIRELEQVVQSLSLFAEGERIVMEDLHQHPELLRCRTPTSQVSHEDAAEAHPPSAWPVGRLVGSLFQAARMENMSLPDLKRELEHHCIREALKEARGNISQAARLLGMKRSRLSQIVNADPELKDGVQRDSSDEDS